MIQKLDFKSPDFTNEHIEKIAALFPNCVTEVQDESGNLKRAIDFDLLKQELSSDIVDGTKERYRLEWPGKRAALVAANTPISKTLRPAKEESVDFDTTKNLYIEGDNLEALKLLQEAYLGAVKMIYIDPPYNTGKDFVYKDNFARSREEELLESGQLDEEGGRLVANLESNGRFHSDWLSMIYPRLRLARNLLRDDGVIFISIDDNEIHNLRKICDEVFGEGNFIAALPTIMNLKGNNDEFGFAGTHEYTLVYGKNKSMCKLYEFKLDASEMDDWLEDDIGLYKKGANLKATGQNAPRERRPNLFFPIYIDNNDTVSLVKKSETDIEVLPITGNQEMSWRWSKEKFLSQIKDIIVVRDKNGNISLYKKQRPSLGDLPSKKPKTIFYKPEYSSGNGTASHKELFNTKLFDAPPKPPLLIKDFIEIGSSNNDIILDFFSGSATTAHAVMQLNAEDGGNRRFILVQLPEPTDAKSEAYKAGYKTIAEIGKERIRRAGKKIMENVELKIENEKENSAFNIQHSKLDIGFRVLKVDSSNFKDIYFNPDSIDKSSLFDTIDHIKEDRTPLDLLFGVLVDWGVDLSLPIEKKEIMGKSIYIVGYNDLIACFEEEIDVEFIKKLAKEEALRVVFKESSFKDDATKINTEQIFKQLAPNTDVRVI